MIIIAYCRGVESEGDSSTGKMLIKHEPHWFAAIMDINKHTGSVVLTVQYVPWDPRLEESVC
jgi:hypothetical protein